MARSEKEKEYRKKYYLEHKDVIKQRSKKYYSENKDKVKEYHRKNRVADKEYHSNYDKKYHLSNSSKKCTSTREWNRRVRLELLTLLGGKCTVCGFDDPRALQVDHINGGGTKDVREMRGHKNATFLKRIQGGSKEYQLLCANCNWIKRVEKKEVRISEQ